MTHPACLDLDEHFSTRGEFQVHLFDGERGVFFFEASLLEGFGKRGRHDGCGLGLLDSGCNGGDGRGGVMGVEVGDYLYVWGSLAT